MFTRHRLAVGSIVILISLLHPMTLHGGGRRRVMAVSSPSAPPAITFVDAAAGVMDTGTITWHGGSKQSVVTVRRVTMRIGPVSHDPAGTSTLGAFLETADPRATVRIDGVTLTNIPRLIRADAPIGVPFSTRIEIEVPASAPEGPLQFAIGWEVTTK
jgi:hypothetical protein